MNRRKMIEDLARLPEGNYRNMIEEQLEEAGILFRIGGQRFVAAEDTGFGEHDPENNPIAENNLARVLGYRRDPPNLMKRGLQRLNRLAAALTRKNSSRDPATAPGAWVPGMLAGFVSAKSMREVIEPTLADMQLEYYEAAEKGLGPARLFVIKIRGYVAIAKALGAWTFFAAVGAVSKFLFDVFKAAS